VSTIQEIKNTQSLTIRIEEAFTKQRILCESLLPQHELETGASNLAVELDQIEGNIREFQQEISNLEQKLIYGAQAIFCTLTKIYIGKELEDQKFDAVIVDEISMALPPLLFLAASRAISRVILVGDFLQLPPIVRSDNEVSNARLKEDTFHLAGVAEGPKPNEGCPVLTRLTTQRRMLTPIADVARHLAYGPDGIIDHKVVKERLVPSWLKFLPPNPLMILDTADFERLAERPRLNPEGIGRDVGGHPYGPGLLGMGKPEHSPFAPPGPGGLGISYEDGSYGKGGWSWQS
jgi:superfamily I DNA and/or RNA helicase